MRDLSRALEQGEAESPLVRFAESLAAPPDAKAVVFVLALDAMARGDVLGWLAGPQHHSVAVRLVDPHGLLDVSLQERGYSLVEAGGRRDFDDAERFAEALRQAGAEHSDLLSPLRLAVAAPTPLCNVRLLVARDARTVASSTQWPALLSRQSAILLVAANAGHSLTEDDMRALQALAGSVAIVWPVVTSQAVGDPAWVRALRSGEPPVLPTSVLSGDAGLVPDFIVQGMRHPLRQWLQRLSGAQTALSLAGMLAERHEFDKRQLQSRLQREALLDKAAQAQHKAPVDKAVFDALKQQAADDTARLMQVLRDRHRRVLLRSGEIGRQVEALKSSLQPADLEREPSGKVIRLTLKPDVVATFRRRLVGMLQREVDEECVLVRDLLDETRRSAESRLAAAGASDASLPMVAPDAGSLWEPLAESAEIDVRYRGEIARRGFVQRLGEGRRIVFVALMVGSLVGSFIGFNVRQAALAGVVCLLLFLGTVAYTYRSWKDDDADSLDKEIDRVRDSVAAELDRSLNEMMRSLQSRWQAFLDDTRRQAHARLDATLRDTTSAKSQNQELERREARARQKLADARLRDLQPLGTRIAESQRQAAALVAAAEAGVRECARDLATEEKTS